MQITSEILKDLLNYDPETGDFTWRRNRRGKAKAGGLAGYVNPAHGRSNAERFVMIFGRNYRVGRLAWLYMTNEWPLHEVDHRDGDSLNNRWTNLRGATRSQNEANKTAYKNNRSGFKGVRLHWYGKWEATLMKDRKRHYLGHFDTAAQAAAAYVAASKSLQGQFSRVA